MNLSDFDYTLPEELIAQTPATPRDHSKLMVLNKKTQTIKHDSFFNLPDYLQKGDVLVFNNSKVFKARLFGSLHQEEAEKKIEIFLLKKIENKDDSEGEYWQVLAKPGRKMKKENSIHFSKDFFATSLEHHDEQTFLIKFNVSGKTFWDKLEEYGHIPIPPYIKNEPKKFTEYQTIYAKKTGSVAAPTAGLHFTNELMKKLIDKGVNIEYITLHVGLGTFAPVKIDDITKHHMHSELAIIDKKTAESINEAKQKGRRIIAIGTTACRALESAVKNEELAEYNDYTNIFIYPPYKFQIVDAMLTNFHLPKSTLLMLISALMGKNFILKAYGVAIENRYRFFSFGDAMFLE